MTEWGLTLFPLFELLDYSLAFFVFGEIGWDGDAFPWALFGQASRGVFACFGGTGRNVHLSVNILHRITSASRRTFAPFAT